MIGILGGMGTQAGLDFCNKLAILYRGKIDQEYPLFILYNKSNIPGRPESIGKTTGTLTNRFENISLAISLLINSNVKIKTSIIDFNNIDDLKSKLKKVDIFLSSVPYKYNLMLTQVALDTCCSMVDLGGHTGNVIKQLDKDR